MQVVTDPDGRLLWLSPALPGQAHDLTAARTHWIIRICERQGVPSWPISPTRAAAPGCPPALNAGSSSGSRTAGSEVTNTALSWLMAWTRALRGRVLGNLEDSDGLDRTITALGNDGRLAAQYESGGSFRVDGVALAPPPTHRPVDLDDLHTEPFPTSRVVRRVFCDQAA